MTRRVDDVDLLCLRERECERWEMCGVYVCVRFEVCRWMNNMNRRVDDVHLVCVCVREREGERVYVWRMCV